MKLYRLYKGCEGEYSCDNYLGLFKTTDSMISFLEDYVKERYFVFFDKDDFEGFWVSLDKNEGLSFSGVGDNEWVLNDIECETIDTGELS